MTKISPLLQPCNSNSVYSGTHMSKSPFVILLICIPWMYKSGLTGEILLSFSFWSQWSRCFTESHSPTGSVSTRTWLNFPMCCRGRLWASTRQQGCAWSFLEVINAVGKSCGVCEHWESPISGLTASYKRLAVMSPAGMVLMRPKAFWHIMGFKRL